MGQSAAQGSSSANKDGVIALIVSGVSVAVLCVALLFLAIFWRPVWCASSSDTADQETGSSDDDNSDETAAGCKEATVSV